MTHFLQDILRQPEELQGTFSHLRQSSSATDLRAAAAAIQNARMVYLTGIGSSWHAALCVHPLLCLSQKHICLRDLSDLLGFTPIPEKTTIIAISRSGRSVEITQLLSKARESGAAVIGITCSSDSPLAREAQVPIVVPTLRDHGISVNTYTTLAAAAGALICHVNNGFSHPLIDSLLRGIEETEKELTGWRTKIETSDWTAHPAATYFLGRGCSLGSCHEARLLWEEGAKLPATAMVTGSFRHGPQEIIRPGMRFGVWIDSSYMRPQDLAVTRDLEQLGAKVMLIGQEVQNEAAGLVFQLPQFPPNWQFLADIIPAQLSAEHLARVSGADADSFRFCSYVVDGEFGLFPQDLDSQKKKAGNYAVT
ncbi:MAG TPA: SIS domain-containing protein [Terriglobales bacterium]|nr:SIS domain-containing protein [Terriglobales bacterium]